MVLCFDCDGTGVVESKVLDKDRPIIRHSCDMCKGTGKIKDVQVDWIIKGLELKESRLGQNVSIRMAAKKLDIEVTYISQMERGVIKPWNEYEFSET